ncbi:cytochrome P450 [Gongronella butleri]|nr:cytochrome P450 [Gongronella butleri]
MSHALALLREPLRFLEVVLRHGVFPASTSTRRKVIVTISSAIGLMVCRQLYVLLHVPRHLQHLPAVNFFTTMRSILRGDPPLKRVQTALAPALAKGTGVYIGNFPVRWTVFIVDPKVAKAMLMKPNQFPKSVDLLETFDKDSPLVKFFGKKNVAIVNGHAWKNQRKVMNPAFHRSMPIGMFTDLMQKGFDVIEQNEHQIKCLDFFHRLTLDALGLGSFGFDFHALEDPNSVWTTTYEEIRRGLRNPYNFLFPRYDRWLRHFIPGRRQFDASVDKLNTLLLDMAHTRRTQLKQAADGTKNDDTASIDADKDLLTLMLEAEMRGEGVMSDNELRDNLAIFFLAGQETTANAMAFFMYSLAQHQDIQEKARQEVLALFGDAPSDIRPSLAETRQLPYLDMVLKENLRRYAPAGNLAARISDEDTVLNGVLIPKRTPVQVDVDAMHANAAVWSDPGRFDPMRFAPGGEYDNLESMAWLPFGGGQRICIGMNLSLTEQRTFAAMLLKKYEWTLPDDSRHKDELKMPSFRNSFPEDLIVHVRPRY